VVLGAGWSEVNNNREKNITRNSSPVIFFLPTSRRPPAGREELYLYKRDSEIRMLNCFRVKRMKRKVTVTQTTAGQRARCRIKYRFFSVHLFFLNFKRLVNTVV
jgi:hypothetical protein